MSSFVATGNGDSSNATITNNGFFPDIDLDAFRSSIRADRTITNERLQEALINAMASTNAELSSLTIKYPEAATLQAITAEQIGGESILVHRYRRAVYCFAKAELLERYVDFDATKSGGERAIDLSPDDDYRRDARWAISDLLGIRRTVVELI